MTHEQHAKKFIANLYLSANGFIGPTQKKEIDEFFRHLKEAIKKDTAAIARCRCEPDV